MQTQLNNDEQTKIVDLLAYPIFEEAANRFKNELAALTFTHLSQFNQISLGINLGNLRSNFLLTLIERGLDINSCIDVGETSAQNVFSSTFEQQSCDHEINGTDRIAPNFAAKILNTKKVRGIDNDYLIKFLVFCFNNNLIEPKELAGARPNYEEFMRDGLDQRVWPAVTKLFGDTARIDACLKNFSERNGDDVPKVQAAIAEILSDSFIARTDSGKSRKSTTTVDGDNIILRTSSPPRGSLTLETNTRELRRITGSAPSASPQGAANPQSGVVPVTSKKGCCTIL